MKVVELPEIRAALDGAAALAAVTQSFRDYSGGRVQQMAVGHLGFAVPPGDCHVKGAHVAGGEFFVVKLATSFYRNPELGLPTSGGFMAVMRADTGAVLAILHDQGWLTDLRTAMAGAIAARAIAKPGARTLGIVGAGTQARLQAEWVSKLLGIDKTLVWARDTAKARALADSIGGESVSLEQLCARADILVTTTPVTTPLIDAAMVKPGARIVALGADAPGKRELDIALTASARLVADSRHQCADHGEAGWAIRAGLLRGEDMLELGELLSSPVRFRDDETVIADLTGLGVQDLAIAATVWRRLAG